MRAVLDGIATATLPLGRSDSRCRASRAFATCRRMSRAYRYSSSPLRVGLTPCTLRSNSRVPKSDSKLRICWLSAGCAILRASAARVMLPQSTIFMKYRSCRRSIAFTKRPQVRLASTAGERNQAILNSYWAIVFSYFQSTANRYMLVDAFAAQPQSCRARSS